MWYNHLFSKRKRTTEITVDVGVGGDRTGKGGGVG